MPGVYRESINFSKITILFSYLTTNLTETLSFPFTPVKV